MTTFEMIADERRTLADLIATLSEEQLRTPSLVPTWTVRDVVGHLVLPVEPNFVKMLVAMVTSRGDMNKAFDKLTWANAKRPVPELVDTLRRRADTRFTPPGAGPEAPLTDVLVHGLDLRRPLGIAREIPEERARIALDFLTRTPARGFVGKGWRDGLRFEATNFGWAQGEGPVLRGHSDALLLAITGRRQALNELEGDGVAILRSRFG